MVLCYLPVTAAEAISSAECLRDLCSFYMEQAGDAESQSLGKTLSLSHLCTKRARKAGGMALLSRCHGLPVERTRCLGAEDAWKRFPFLQNDIT